MSKQFFNPKAIYPVFGVPPEHPDGELDVLGDVTSLDYANAVPHLREATPSEPL